MNGMKQNKIFMQMWLDSHDRNKIISSDQWYLDFANRLLPLLNDSYLYGRATEEDRQYVAVALAIYLEDCVADSGNWNRFICWHRQSYGKYLPFYQVTAAYIPDEINREDIAFLLWSFNSPIGDDFDEVENPFDKDLLEFAATLYECMDGVFEEAPISEALAGDWLVETELMQKQLAQIPEFKEGEKLPANIDRFLKASGGKPLMFFNSYSALRFFFIHSLGWENEDDSLLTDLEEFTNFVVYVNPKGLLIGPDVAEYFCDVENPLYNKGASEEEAYALFCEQGCCPFDLLKYGMEHHLLEDAQFPFENGKELLHENWDFIARWFLGEFYEGE